MQDQAVHRTRLYTVMYPVEEAIHNTYMWADGGYVQDFCKKRVVRVLSPKHERAELLWLGPVHLFRRVDGILKVRRVPASRTLSDCDE